MKSLIRVFIPFMTFLFTANCCGAIGKITIDPNTTGVKAALETDKSFWDADKRLGQKLTYEARKQPVRVILSDLSAITGVELKAGYNKVDWQVRDRRMNIFAKDIPLNNLMQSIARVMKFKWSRNTDIKPYTYRLYMDRKTVLEAEAESQREQEKYLREMAEKRKSFFEDLLNLDSLSPDELNALKEINPVLYEQTMSDEGLSFTQWLRKTPDVADAFINGAPLNLTGADLSPESRKALENATRSCLNEPYSFDGIVSGDDLAKASSNLTDIINKFKITINPHLRDYLRDPTGGMEVGQLSFSYGNSYIFHVYWSPDNPMRKLYTKLRIMSQDQGRPYGDLVKEHISECASAEIKMQNEFPFGDPIMTHSDDPDLNKKYKIKLEGTTYWSNRNITDYEAALFKATGFTIVSDCLNQPIINNIPSTETELKNIVEAISTGFRSNWWKNGQTIEFRNRDWFYRRSQQIPDAQLGPWNRFFEKNGYLDIDIMSQIAQLTWEQQCENQLSDGTYLTIFGNNTSLLKLYASLNSVQRKVIFGAGLSSVLINESQSEIIKRTSSSIDKELLPMLSSGSMLKGVKSNLNFTHESHVLYTFTLTSPELKEPAIWRVESPTYHKPVPIKIEGKEQ